MDANRMDPIIKRNADSLRKLPGLSASPFAIYKTHLRQLRPGGDPYRFPDGTLVSYEEATLPALAPRRVVFAQDTSDASSLLPIARGADLLVHEATTSESPDVDDDERGYVSQPCAGAVTAARTTARSRGHSTDGMAGESVAPARPPPDTSRKHDLPHSHSLKWSRRSHVSTTLLKVLPGAGSGTSARLACPVSLELDKVDL
eukprot:GHVT01005700.1.p2 GENE.GHVT01005700.1~~GHVT01005700.1.p2  ORF type:complete len:202 (+),score=31.57 GHVT01005700.1:1862-2467(+)